MVKIPLNVYSNADKLYSYDFGGRQPRQGSVQIWKRRADVFKFELNFHVVIL